MLDISQHDESEWQEEGACYVQLLFEDGLYAKFPIGDLGFHHNCDPVEEPDGAAKDNDTNA